MRWRFWRRAYPGNGELAKRSRVEAERKLKATRRDWPEVNAAADRLAQWIDAALRGHGA
jgi:hypothetical protein